jgi:2',3'-cyclic-nucleotide 2'-phosphodiesterase (5'-nucleotidase family)
MAKLKNYNAVLVHFVLFLTYLFVSACSTTNLQVTKVEGKLIPIASENRESAEISKFIQPYKEHIDKDLSTVLAFAPETIDKNGAWQTPMGNLFSTVVFEKGNPIFKKRENLSIDIVLLNHGGIRTIIPKGNVTARTAFEIMPFENSLVVIELKGEQIEDLLNYFITEKKPHPLYGMTFTIGKDNDAKDILIQGKSFDKNTSYFVGTNDYLANGGDNMIFFKKGIHKYDLDYKLRNILIDYFTDVETVPLITDQRITVEK